MSLLIGVTTCVSCYFSLSSHSSVDCWCNKCNQMSGWFRFWQRISSYVNVTRTHTCEYFSVWLTGSQNAIDRCYHIIMLHIIMCLMLINCPMSFKINYVGEELLPHRSFLPGRGQKKSFQNDTFDLIWSICICWLEPAQSTDQHVRIFCCCKSPSLVEIFLTTFF